MSNTYETIFDRALPYKQGVDDWHALWSHVGVVSLVSQGALRPLEGWDTVNQTGLNVAEILATEEVFVPHTVRDLHFVNLYINGINKYVLKVSISKSLILRHISRMLDTKARLLVKLWLVRRVFTVEQELYIG